MLIKNEAVRAYIYRIALAVLVVLAAYGLIENEKVPMIIGVLGALLPTGLAVANTSTGAPPPNNDGMSTNALIAFVIIVAIIVILLFSGVLGFSAGK